MLFAQLTHTLYIILYTKKYNTMRQSLGRCAASSPAEATAAPHASSHHHVNHTRHLHGHVVSASKHGSSALTGNVLPFGDDSDLPAFEETVIMKLSLHSRVLALELNIGVPMQGQYI